VPLIHGVGSTSSCTKPATYLNPANPGSVNAQRDPFKHSLHRKRWDRALSGKASMAYIDPILVHLGTLLKQLQARNGQSLHINPVIHLFSFDVMGSIGFGFPEGFRQLEKGELHPSLRDLLAMMRFGVYMMMIPWLHCILGALPDFGLIYKPDEEFRDFARSAMERTRKEKSPNKGRYSNDKMDSETNINVMSYVLEQDPRYPLTDRELTSDALILCIAGSDNSTSSAIHSMYRLARHPNYQNALYAEISSIFPEHTSTEKVDNKKRTNTVVTASAWPALNKLPLLEAFINEVFRLHPPAPSGMPRETPAQGLTLANGTYIPPHVNISSPVYSLHRDSQNFGDPESFRPERWMTPRSDNDQTALEPALQNEWVVTPRPDLILDKRAFMPFLTGPYGCAGRRVAYMELKLLLAAIVLEFVIDFPEGADVNEVIRKMEWDWKDYTTVQAADVELRFLSRH
jgi:cytochrome P450